MNGNKNLRCVRYATEVLFSLLFGHGILENLTDTLPKDDLRQAIAAGRILIDEDDRIAAELPDKTGRRPNDQAGSADNQHIRLPQRLQRTGNDLIIQRLFEKDDVRLDHGAAALAVRNRLGQTDEIVDPVVSMTARAIIAMDGAVQLVHTLAPRALVQTVDILRDDGVQPAGLFQTGKGIVRAIRLHIFHHAFANLVILKKFNRMLLIEMVRHHLFGGPGRTRVACEYAVLAAKIGNIGLGGDTGSAEKNDPLMRVDKLPEAGETFCISDHGNLLRHKIIGYPYYTMYTCGTCYNGIRKITERKRRNSMQTYDLIVVGTGAALTVVEIAAKVGQRVAVVEKARFGGTCLNRGCIPTKIMVSAADTVREAALWQERGIVGDTPRIDWDTVSRRLWSRIDTAVELERRYEELANVDVYRGTASFTAPKELTVALESGGTAQLTAPKIVLGVGGRTRVDPIPGMTADDYLTSESFFGPKYWHKLPESVIIFGGGPIGTEFAHSFSAAGVEVHLVQRNVRLLPKEEPVVSEFVYRSLLACGIRIYRNRVAQAVRREDGDIVVTVRNRSDGDTQEIRAEQLFIATGIVPNTDILQAEAAGIELDDAGYIRTNEFLETSVPGIYALGDVNGRAPFRHKANYEADIIAHNLYEHPNPDEWRWARYDRVPIVTFTWPETAHVGLTEEDARKAGHTVRIADHHYAATAKGYALGIREGSEEDGFIRLVVDEPSGEILGAHIVGPQASLLLQPFVNLLNAGPTPLMPLHEHIASPEAAALRQKKPVRSMDPHSVYTMGETMAPHPSLNEVSMWTRYYYEGRD